VRVTVKATVWATRFKIEMDTVEIKLLKYKFRFRQLAWREEMEVKLDPKKNRLRSILSHALVEVSGLKVDTAEAAMKVLDAMPVSVIQRVFILWRDAAPAPRLFSTVGLYKAPAPNQFVKEFEKVEEQREHIMDMVEQEMEKKFGKKELEEARAIERQMAINSKMRGATKPSSDKPLGKP
jgi:hypothetical protein